VSTNPVWPMTVTKPLANISIDPSVLWGHCTVDPIWFDTSNPEIDLTNSWKFVTMYTSIVETVLQPNKPLTVMNPVGIPQGGPEAHNVTTFAAPGRGAFFSLPDE